MENCDRSQPTTEKLEFLCIDREWTHDWSGAKWIWTPPRRAHPEATRAMHLSQSVIYIQLGAVVVNSRERKWSIAMWMTRTRTMAAAANAAPAANSSARCPSKKDTVSPGRVTTEPNVAASLWEESAFWCRDRVPGGCYFLQVVYLSCIAHKFSLTFNVNRSYY